MKKQKFQIIIFLIYFILFSSLSESKEKEWPFYDHFTNEILTGEEKNIELIVNLWINFIIKQNDQNLLPLNLKTKKDFHEFFQLLEASKKTPNSFALIKIANYYLSSVEIIFIQILRNTFENSSFSILHEVNMFIDYLIEEKKMDKIIREIYISSIFLSLAGFSSPNGKYLYIKTIEKAQFLHDFFHKLYIHFKSTFHNTDGKNFFQNPSQQINTTNALFTKLKNFNSSFIDLENMLFEIIIPAFKELSWVKNDVNHSPHPSTLFRYGRILHRAHGEKHKGLHYISLSEEANYLPAIKYLGEYYLSKKGILKTKGENLMLQFLRKSSRNTTEKISIIYDLLLVNTKNEKNIIDFIYKGTSSLKRSCSAAFRFH